MSEQHPMGPPSLPPGASAQEILISIVPLLVKTSTDSARAATAAAGAMSSLESSFESELQQLRQAVEHNTKAVQSLVEEKKRANDLADQSHVIADKYNERWHETLRSWFTPPVIINILAIAAAAFGLYSAMPQPVVGSSTAGVAPQTVSPVRMVPMPSPSTDQPLP